MTGINNISYQPNSLSGYAGLIRTPKFYSPLSGIDEYGKIKMNPDNIHIQSIQNGFLITKNIEFEGFRSWMFSTFDEVLDFLKEYELMTNDDDDEVADNL